MHFPSFRRAVTFLLLLLHCFLLSASCAAAGQPPPLSQQSEGAGEEARLRAALKTEPKNPAYAARLGALLSSENRLPAAASFYEQALKLNRGNTDIRRNLGVTYWQLGRLADARKNLELL